MIRRSVGVAGVEGRGVGGRGSVGRRGKTSRSILPMISGECWARCVAGHHTPGALLPCSASLLSLLRKFDCAAEVLFLRRVSTRPFPAAPVAAGFPAP